MELTGTPFFILTIVLFVSSIALAVANWGRGRGGRTEDRGGRRRGRGRGRRGSSGATPLGYLGSLGTVLLCQVTAIMLVFTWVNDDTQLYDGWGDLLGTASHVRAVPPPPADNGPLTAPATPNPADKASFHPPSSSSVPRDVEETDLKGKLSGVDGEVLVWTPPQYNDPAYQHKDFPVVELLAGFPGSSSAWFGSAMNATKQLAPLMKDGKVTPFILVSPRVELLGNDTDTGCADVPGKVNADTWLARDVPQMILDNFRTVPDAGQWAVAGYSAGGHCANRLVIGHPDRFRAAISMSGYNDPVAEPASLTAKDPALRVADNPLNMLTHATTPPNVALWESGRKADGDYQDGVALQQAAKPPTTVTVLETTGPHLTSTWQPLVVPVFTWLSGIIPAPK